MSNAASGTPENKLYVSIASTAEEIEQCQRLRYRVLVKESNISPTTKNLNKPTLDKDRFDNHCKHLLVAEQTSQRVVASARLMTDEDAQANGCFHSATQFDLNAILQKRGRFMEVGRCCIHPDYQQSGAMALLWQGITRMIAIHKTDYLISCASIPLQGGHHYANALMNYLRKHHLSDQDTRAFPRIPLLESGSQYPDEVVIAPPLLRAYLRQGAVICGEPYWDSAFGVADVFVFLDCDKLSSRQVRHFDLKRA